MTSQTEQGGGEARHSRAPFAPQGFEIAPGERIDGSDGDDVLRPGAAPSEDAGLPGALAFWSFAEGVGGSFADARGGPSVTAYRLHENQALVEVDAPTRPGPDGTPGTALEFDGESSFGFIAHDASLEVTQGTVALWLQPDDLSSDAIVLSKDQSGAGDGGHFRLGFEEGGRLFLRFADGNGGQNYAWESSKAYLAEGQWTHVAVSFTADGITVYADGVAIPDYGWARAEGDLDSPAQASEAYLLQNAEPWVLGADNSGTRLNDTAAEFATDDERLDDAFDGAVADFGLWGGFSPADALDAGEVWQLFSAGPGEALSAPSGPQPMMAGDDVIGGGLGNDHLSGEAGDDELRGGAGNDSISTGRGRDRVDGGVGDDVIDGGRGADTLGGGDGDDVILGDRGSDIIDGGDGNDTVSGGAGRDTIAGGDGADVVHGDGGADVIDAGAGDDEVDGGRGRDVIVGGAGDDAIEGGAGMDVIAGGAGDDDLTGGRGRDVFVFELPEAGQTLGFDVVHDFRSARDGLLVANDLLVALDAENGFTRMTLSDATGDIVGVADIYGSAVDPLSDIIRPGEGSAGDVLFG